MATANKKEAMRDQDLCDRAREFFARLLNDEARAWAHGVINAIRATYPAIDVWATGGLDQYVDIRMGKRGREALRGAPVLYLWIDTNSKWPRLWVHEDIRHGVRPHPLTHTAAPAENDVRQWLIKHATQFSSRLKDLSGRGLNPVSYQNIAGVKARDETDELNIAEQPIFFATPVLNQILFGPPGTGKTFSTIEQALRILDPQLPIEAIGRSDLKKAFDHYVALGQIVFTTFHQSFSYEDFVEGLRAVSTEGELEYVVEAGVFKRLCERASAGLVADEDPFDAALALLQAQLEQAGGVLEMKTPSGKKFKVAYEGGTTFGFVPDSSQGNGSENHSKYRANMTYVRKLFFGADAKGMYNISYVRGMLNYLREKCELPATPPVITSNQPKKPFILIIDEINRGNVSRIFGELITLIEPSKRAGQPEALEVTLPYSKEAFSVPDNVFIIGTMNTADRSLSGLDIALRRRFEFVEMPPQPELLSDLVVDGVNIGELLQVMNDRIEVLLDRDHCFGHSYFIELRSFSEPGVADLARIFRNKIFPLLQEYFFEDWERIAWVLNDHRKTNESCRFLIRPASTVEELFGPDVAVAPQGLRWTINPEAFSSIQAYAEIIDASGSGAVGA